jgi:hypothetical protein
MNYPSNYLRVKKSHLDYHIFFFFKKKEKVKKREEASKNKKLKTKKYVKTPNRFMFSS